MTRKPRIYRGPVLFAYQTMREKLLAIPNERERLFFLCAYANGTRISEATEMRFWDIQWDTEFLYIRSNVLKKRGELPIRNSPIPRLAEAWLTESIIDIALKLRTSPEDKEKVWQMSKRTAQYRCDEYFGGIVHSMRHNRATHLINEYGFQLLDLREYFSLSDKGLAEWQGIYGHLTKSHLVDKWRVLIANKEAQTHE